MIEKRILITGAGGFTARHFLDFLRASGAAGGRVFGTDIKNGSSALDESHFIKADLLDKAEVSAILNKVRPDFLFHFAGLNSGADHNELLRANVFATNNLLEGVVSAGLKSRVLVIGSAAEYGLAGGAKGPIKETTLLAPITPYGVSKAAQTVLATQYAASYGVYVVIARSFNLIGPGQPASLVCGSIVNQVKAICSGKGGADKLVLGNTDTERDFVDIRDAVSAYWRLLAEGDGLSGQVFNVGSGKANSIKYIIEILSGYCGRKIEVEQRIDRVRPNDIKTQVADIGKIKAAVGWRGAIDIKTSIIDMYERSK